jgi:ABC-2 type transport system ATP-binding protein
MVTTHFMDEAEHCDEIGFIFEGSLIASDSPGNLQQSIPGTLLEIPTATPMELLTQLEAEKVDCLDMYPLGARLHVLVTPGQLPQFAPFPYEIITPSLEDVFVYLVKSHRKELVA